MLYLNINVQKYTTYRKIRRLELIILNMLLCRLHDHSVCSVWISRSTMKSSAFFSLFLVLNARKCLAGIIIQTNKPDEDFILKAAVSSLFLDSYNYIMNISNHGSSAKYNFLNFFSFSYFPFLLSHHIWSM